MSWKDYLAFNRFERNGIMVFIILLIIIILLPQIHKKYFISEAMVNPESFKEDILAFEEQLSRLEKERGFTDDGSRSRETTGIWEPRTIVALRPFNFNPNNLPEESWLKMGMPERIVRTIKNFEAAGGSFRVKEDMNRIYGITDQMYLTLEPYINLPSRDSYHEYYEGMIEPKMPEPIKTLIIDINSADTLELMNIRGIGHIISNRIVRYRELLGGYVSVNQLLEVYGIDEERFENIKQHIAIKDTNIRKININKAGFEDMRKHPYIDVNLANSLIQIREQHGNFKTIEDIKKSHLVDEDTYSLIAPYISVE